MSKEKFLNEFIILKKKNVSCTTNNWINISLLNSKIDTNSMQFLFRNIS